MVPTRYPLPQLILVALCTLASCQVADGYRLIQRWTNTASGATGPAGSAMTLTWSFVPDDTTIPDVGQSDLIAALDDRLGSGPGGPDLTLRPWFAYFEGAFDRWSRLSGVTYLYEPNDDGLPHGNFPGALGVRGDVRIGGTFIDGGGTVLGYNFMPNNGDMVLDSSEQLLYTDADQNHLRLRNLVMHEHGHGLGFAHVGSVDSNFLLERFIDLTIDGPQIDDIRGLHRAYGDVLEKTNDGEGNDRAQNATPLGVLPHNSVVTVGADGGPDTTVEADDVDFVSIDNSNDFDYFSFAIAGPALLDLILMPVGPTYLEGLPGGAQYPIDASSISDLSLALFDTDGISILDIEDSGGLGEPEKILRWELTEPGEYFVRARGTQDDVQLYRLEILATYVVPEPTSGLSGLCGWLLLVALRRRANASSASRCAR
jgi:hypothetical protein